MSDSMSTHTCHRGHISDTYGMLYVTKDMSGVHVVDHACSKGSHALSCFCLLFYVFNISSDILLGFVIILLLLLLSETVH